MSSPAPALDLAKVRASFPSLASGYLFADNAGGSQCLRTVADAISSYLLDTNVQLGADYAVSKSATARVDEGQEAVREMFNAARREEVLLGSSSTQCAENLARGIEGDVREDEEIVVTPEHEGTSRTPGLFVVFCADVLRCM
jgi:selenocysteine lyase/cysteine desulfurase